MRIFLTGIGGFLGSHLAAHWVRSGHEVSGASSSGAALDGVRRVTPFSLGRPVDTGELAGIDVVIHLAYDRAAGLEANDKGTRLVAMAAESAGVARQIFVSSYSARPDALSEYGRLKFGLETYFGERGGMVVRPGLVVGNGGLFQRNMRKILTAPVLPLLNGGRDLMPVVAVEDCAAAMTVLLDGRAGAFNLFNPEMVSMRRFVETINRMAGHRAFYLPVPGNLAARLLTVAARLGIKLPVDADNLKAMQQNQAQIHYSDLTTLIESYSSFEEMIAKLDLARN